MEFPDEIESEMATLDRFLKAQSPQLPADVIEFIKARREGAAAIAESSKEKGGVAILTAWHFSAKDPAYEDAEGIFSREDFDSEEKLTALRTREGDLMRALTQPLGQVMFQELMGKLEVYGEIHAFIEEQVQPVK